MVFIMGAVGFTLNILSVLFLHGRFAMTTQSHELESDAILYRA